jgi:hypothetical protein
MSNKKYSSFVQHALLSVKPQLKQEVLNETTLLRFKHDPCYHCKFPYKDGLLHTFKKRPDNTNVQCRLTLQHTAPEYYKDIFQEGVLFLASSRKSDRLEDFTLMQVTEYVPPNESSLKDILTVPVRVLKQGNFGNPQRRNSKPWVCVTSNIDVTQADPSHTLHLPLAPILEDTHSEVYFLHSESMDPIISLFFYNRATSKSQNKPFVIFSKTTFEKFGQLIESTYFDDLPSELMLKDKVDTFYRNVYRFPNCLKSCKLIKYALKLVYVQPTQANPTTVQPLPADTQASQSPLVDFKLNPTFGKGSMIKEGLNLFKNLVPKGICDYYLAQASDHEKHPLGGYEPSTSDTSLPSDYHPVFNAFPKQKVAEGERASYYRQQCGGVPRIEQFENDLCEAMKATLLHDIQEVMEEMRGTKDHDMYDDTTIKELVNSMELSPP